jgi:hypothetical protein
MWVLVVLVVVTAVAVWGIHEGARRTLEEHLSKIGLTAGCARRYHRAVEILERLDGSTDKAGLLAGDVLSAETHQMVVAWTAEHRKEFPPK